MICLSIWTTLIWTHRKWDRIFKRILWQKRRNKSYEENKGKIEALLKKISKEQKAKSEAIKNKDNEEFFRMTQRSAELLQNARRELIKQADELHQVEKKFRAQIRREHEQMLKDNKSMMEGIKAKEVDLINYAEYVQEFYDKMNHLYIKDYESRIKDLEKLNQELNEKRALYEEFKDKPAPKEDPIAKIVINHEKLGSYSHHNEEWTFKPIGGQKPRESRSSENGPLIIIVSTLTLFIGGTAYSNYAS